MKLRKLGVGMFACMLVFNSVSIPAASGLAERRTEVVGTEVRVTDLSAALLAEDSPETTVTSEPDKSTETQGAENPSETPTSSQSSDPAETPAPSDSTESPAPSDSTESPTPSDSTESPAPSESAEPSESPAALTIDVAAAKTVYKPNETVVWTFTCAGANSISYAISGGPSGSADPADGSISFTPSAAGTYTLTATASAEGQESVSATSTVYVTETGEAVDISLSADARYTKVNGSVGFKANISGGAAPYSVAVRVADGEGTVDNPSQEGLEAGEISFTYTPSEGGTHKLTITVTDAMGMTDAASATLPVSTSDTGNDAEWEAKAQAVSLTGDPRVDLVAVAQSQVGYQESTKNFTIGEDGEVQGHTLYGAWYGADYDEWCAMFISYCLNSAGIDALDFPRNANCNNWVIDLRAKEMFEDKGTYTPEPGDLIFFNSNSRAAATHVGIVESVTETGINTIEGNKGKMVTRMSYSLDDACIVGYGRLLPKAERNPEITLIASWESDTVRPDGKATLGVGDKVTLTAKDTGNAKLLWQCQKAEDGEWETAPNQDGSASYTFEVTRENCGWAWRATYDDAEETEVVEG